MNTQNKTLLQRISPKNYSFGLKLNILVLLLVFISLVMANIIYFWLFRKYIKKTSIENLEIAIVPQKEAVEKQYENLLKIIASIPNESLGNEISGLKTSFNNYAQDLNSLSNSWNDSLRQYKLAISNYYTTEFVDKINFNKPLIEMVEPTNDNTIALQYYYLVKNPFSFETNYELIDAGDRTEYASYHSKLQKKFHTTFQKNHFNNIYIIDSDKGNILYTYKKNIALGGNIFSDYLKRSDLAIAFQKALLLEQGKVVTQDFNYFLPEYNKPSAFLSVPVYYNEKLYAVLVVELAPDYFSSNLTSKNEQQQEVDLYSFNIIGEDKLLRNYPHEEIADYESFIKMLNHVFKKNDKSIILGTGALTLGFDENLVPGKKVTYTGKDYLQQKSFITSVPLNIAGLNWYLVATSSFNKAYAYYNKVKFVSIIDFIILFVFALVVSYAFRKSITIRLNKLKVSLKELVKGEHSEKINSVWNDEVKELLDSFYELRNRIDTASEFALHLSAGEYSKDFKAISENDKFALALNTLKKALIDSQDSIDKREQEDKIRNWINEGIAKFNDLLRQSNNDIKNLAYIIIENLIEYIHANIGGIFLVEGENESDKYISLIASYAYDRRKYLTKRIEIGEGLIGNCYLEKKPVYLTKLPSDYMEIGSGLGKAIPSVLYIVPLLYDQEVLGFIEIASLESLKKHELEFINKLSENIAATFSSVKLNTKTAILLEESKRRANEIAQQEEEMRQNLEEMQATQEELARLRDEDEQKTKDLQLNINKARAMLQELVNSMTGEVYIKDANGVIILANEEIAKRFSTIPQKMVGKTDNDIFPQERAEKEHELDKLVINEGIYSDEIIELVGTKEQKYFFVKKQFNMPITKETGVITIRNKR